MTARRGFQAPPRRRGRLKTAPYRRKTIRDVTLRHEGCRAGLPAPALGAGDDRRARLSSPAWGRDPKTAPHNGVCDTQHSSPH
jgi:hypothetical protein